MSPTSLALPPSSGRPRQFFSGSVPQQIDEPKPRAAAAPDPAERQRLADQAYVQENYLADLAEVRPRPPSRQRSFFNSTTMTSIGAPELLTSACRVPGSSCVSQ